MKVLITGGAGFIASHVVDLYIENGFEVIIVDNLSTGRKSNLNPKAAFYKLDIRNPEIHQFIANWKPDIINHHAAQMDVRRSVVDPMFDAEVNVVGSINLLEAARNNRVKKFVYISSGGAVYGEPHYLPCDELHPVEPICPYGASKHTIEHYLFMYQVMYGLDYAVLRYPNVYGPRQDPHGEAGVVAIFTGKMLKNQQVIINGDGEQTRDYVYVGDCAAANLMVSTNSSASGIYNLGSGVGTSVNQIFDGLKAITDYPLQPIYGPPKLGETRHIYLSADKAHQELGWKPMVDLSQGLKKTVDYFRQSEPDL